MYACRVVTDELAEGKSLVPALHAIRILASYFVASSKARALSDVEEMVTSGGSTPNATAQLAAATIYLHEGHPSKALKFLLAPGGAIVAPTASGATPAATLELLSLLVQSYLRIDRPDLAEGAVKRMQEMDDECALTTASSALLKLSQGGEARVRESMLLFKELEDRFGSSDATEGGSSRAAQNGIAAALLTLHKPEEAEKVLTEVLKAHPADADTHINLIAVYAQQGRLGKVAEYTARLKEVAPTHPYVAGLDIADSMFERVAATFAS